MRYGVPSRRRRARAAAHVDDALQPAVVDDADAIGEPRELVEVVRRDEDDAVVAAQRVHDVAEALRPHRIEPVRRLVEHDHLLLARAAPARDRVAAGSPSRAACTRLLRCSSRPSRSIASSTRARSCARRHAGEQRVAAQRLVRAPRRRDVHELGEIADAVPLDEPARLEPVDAHRALARPEEAEQQRDQRALARAVRAREPEHLAGAAARA